MFSSLSPIWLINICFFFFFNRLEFCDPELVWTHSGAATLGWVPMVCFLGWAHLGCLTEKLASPPTNRETGMCIYFCVLIVRRWTPPPHPASGSKLSKHVCSPVLHQPFERDTFILLIIPMENGTSEKINNTLKVTGSWMTELRFLVQDTLVWGQLA